MKNYAITRIKKHKAGSSAKYLINHHLRSVAVANADPDREHLNKVLFQVENVEEFLAKAPAGTKCNATRFVDVIFTASRFESKEQLDQWVKSTMEFAQEEFLAKNIALAVLHMDESTPHIHVLWKPVNPKTKKLGAGHWFDGKNKMKTYQDKYFSKVKHLAFDRGTPGSRAKHTTIKQFYKNVKNAKVNTLDIHKELDKLEKTLKKTSVWDTLKGNLFDAFKPIFANLSKQARAVAIQAELNQTAKKSEETKKLADRVAFLEMKLKDLTGSENPSLSKMEELKKAIYHFQADIPKKPEPVLANQSPTATQQKSKLKL